jgi:hypothetical protein
MVCLPMVGAAMPSSMVACGPRLCLLMEGATAVGNQEGADGGGVEPWKGSRGGGLRHCWRSLRGGLVVGVWMWRGDLLGVASVAEEVAA